MKLGETCKHGGLRRCCELCDSLEQTAELEMELEKTLRLMELLKKANFHCICEEHLEKLKK